MSFSNPNQTYWILLLFLFSLLAWRDLKKKKKSLSQLIGLDLLQKIFSFEKWKRINFRKTVLEFFALFFLILAMIGPQIGQKLQEIQVKGSSIFILFDCSDSMLAEDFKPNRLEKSKQSLSALLERLVGDKVGLIVFAGDAYVYCPLTFDISATKQFLKSIQPGLVPQPGTRIGSAIRLALEKMGEGTTSNAIVLLTDGEDHHSDPIGAAEEAKKRGVKIFSIGIGNREGEPIPIRENGGTITGYKKNKKGEVVLSKMDESTLAQISLMTGGSYFRASPSEGEIDLLVSKLGELKGNTNTQKQNSNVSRYQWCLALFLFFWLLSESIPFLNRRMFRLGLKLAFFLILCQKFSPVLQAQSFKGEMNRGVHLYHQKKYPESLDSFKRAQNLNPGDLRADFNQGATLYKQGDYDKTISAFQKSSLSLDPILNYQSAYNLGNTYFKKGDYDSAIQFYRQSLGIHPTDSDVKYNLNLALILKNAQPSKNQKSSEQEKQGKGKTEEQKKKEFQELEEKKEKEENAKRVLRSANSNEINPRVFKPIKEGEKENVEEDW